MERESATFTCPKCYRKNRTLADEAGDHGCSCGWGPYSEAEETDGLVPFSSAAEDVDPEDVRGYVEYCRIINVRPDADAFSIMFRTKYGHIPGRDIQRLLDEEGE